MPSTSDWKAHTPTGWTPAHLLLEGAGALLGCAPVYLKTHSFGEYVFDHHWAEAYERAGGRYYPRLVCAAPFSPVPGPRLLAETATAKSALAAALIGCSGAGRTADIGHQGCEVGRGVELLHGEIVS